MTTSLSHLLNAARPAHQLVAFGPAGDKTWQQFRTDVATLSHQLQAERSKRWALCCQDSYFFAVAFCAAAHADKSLLLPGNQQPEALQSLSEHIDGILTDQSINLEHAMQLRLPEALEHDVMPQCWFADLDLAALTLTLFTSGSSGYPKAISKHFTHLDAEVSVLETLWGDDTILEVESTVSHQHIYGLLFRLLWPLCTGRAFARENLVFPEQVIAHSHHSRVLISSPALLKRLQHESAPAANPYRAVFSSGGPLSPDGAKASLDYLQQLPHEVFGSTETGGIAHRQQFSTTTPWQLMPGIEGKQNELGCLMILSPFVGNEWYHTDDLIELSGDTFLLKGRADRVVKIEEKRVSLSEIEQHLERNPWIDDAAVAPTQGQGNRTYLGAVVTLTAEGQHFLTGHSKGKLWIELRQYLKKWLEPVAIPRRILIVAQLPINAQGKRQHHQIKALLEQHHEQPQEQLVDEA
ncbi:D-alanine--D-alanyl carrier protein ligase [Vibrio stylophorae]|uniref:D-alanine--D-alanyl carrier protein ligase n=1 Tax=Vibrio stylophorae TaxID=659351 RepID=A0ABM8ZVD8_9VIBR|nr:AMP-binding protein [Vibrio stylophorae]CAH0533971.1 D-alanine--D-alanyl carrier protein ligase [Vibrio stylophorae]